MKAYAEKKNPQEETMTVRELAEKLELRILSMPDPEREISGAYAGDLLSWVMGRAKEDSVWAT